MNIGEFAQINPDAESNWTPLHNAELHHSKKLNLDQLITLVKIGEQKFKEYAEKQLAGVTDHPFPWTETTWEMLYGPQPENDQVGHAEVYPLIKT
jgi:hypothetical protein